MRKSVAKRIIDWSRRYSELDGLCKLLKFELIAHICIGVTAWFLCGEDLKGATSATALVMIILWAVSFAFASRLVRNAGKTVSNLK